MSEERPIGDGIVAALERAQTLDGEGRERAEAHDMAAAARAWTQSAAMLRSTSTALTLRLAEVLERAAAATAQAGDPEAGYEMAREAISLLRHAREAGAFNDLSFAEHIGRLGMMHCAMQRWDDAAGLLSEADALLAAPSTGQAPPRLNVAISGALATALRFAGRRQEAIAVSQRASDQAQTVATLSGKPEDQVELAHQRITHGQLLLEADMPDAALPVLDECVESLRRVVENTHHPEPRNLLAAALNKLGHAHAASGNRGEASARLGESVTLMRALVEQDGLAGLADDLRTAENDLANLGSHH